MLRTKNLFVFLCVLCASVVNLFAQETPPAPSAPKSATVPAVKEKKLPNGLTVAVVERKGVPLVTIQLLVKNGADSEANKAGLADFTASMLTKGTKTKTATQIAEAIEFLGGSINSGAGWNSSFVSVTVTSDKVAQAMAILADVVLNPKFDQKELDLLKSQTLDGLTYNLKQPSFLANYVASKYSFGEHPAGGTPASIKNISRSNLVRFNQDNYEARESVLIFAGDISANAANTLARQMFTGMKTSKPRRELIQQINGSPIIPSKPERVKSIVVVDLPKSGQTAVNYARGIEYGRTEIDYATGKIGTQTSYYSALVLNSVLGGGYSSRLNYEIRIKRGLSYGAGSNFGWRSDTANFATRVQTKNESAAQVAELTLDEIERLTNSSVSRDELVPRKSVLTGGFGRNLETTGGLANALGDLYAFGIPTSELNKYVSSVNAVTDAQIKDFASRNLLGGDIIIVGDYSIFKDDLAKRFPGMKVEVIKADDLDLSKDNLHK